MLRNENAFTLAPPFRAYPERSEGAARAGLKPGARTD